MQNSMETTKMTGSTMNSVVTHTAKTKTATTASLIEFLYFTLYFRIYFNALKLCSLAIPKKSNPRTENTRVRTQTIHNRTSLVLLHNYLESAH